MAESVLGKCSSARVRHDGGLACGRLWATRTRKAKSDPPEAHRKSAANGTGGRSVPGSPPGSSKHAQSHWRPRRRPISSLLPVLSPLSSGRPAGERQRGAVRRFATGDSCAARPVGKYRPIRSPSEESRECDWRAGCSLLDRRPAQVPIKPLRSRWRPFIVAAVLISSTEEKLNDRSSYPARKYRPGPVRHAGGGCRACLRLEP